VKWTTETLDQRSELKEQWMKNPAFKAEYDALEDEFSLARQLIEARTRAGLSQAELAQHMGTTQSAIARLESGKARAVWESAGGGSGIHWPEIDEDLSTEGLLRRAPAPRGVA
jgi:DNA-binding XRE family transcriptional regulator